VNPNKVRQKKSSKAGKTPRPDDAMMGIQFVRRSGYQVVTRTVFVEQGEKEAARVLVEKTGEPLGYSFYDPVRKEPPDGGDLLLELVNLNVEKVSDVEQFAGRFGLLGVQTVLTLVTGRSTDFCEPIAYWANAVCQLRVCMEVVGAWKKKDTAKLKGLLVPFTNNQGQPAFKFRSGVEFLRKDSTGKLFNESAYLAAVDPPFNLTFRKGDYLTPAAVLIGKLIRDGMKDTVKASMLYDPPTGSPTFRVSPTGLLGACWLKLAQYVDAGRVFMQCETCGNWAVVHHAHRHHRQKRFCSKACKAVARRLRQRKTTIRKAIKRKGD
jgi:hypothetical protein